MVIFGIINIEYESNGDRNKNLSLEEYLDEIRPYLRDTITDLQESDIWKIKLTIATSFISPKDIDGERVMCSKRDIIKFMLCNNAYVLFMNVMRHFVQDIKGI